MDDTTATPSINPIGLSAVAAHLRTLQQTCTIAQLCTLAGVNRRDISHLGEGHVDLAVVDAIMALDPARPDTTARRVPAAGSRRRVEALMVRGWPVNVIAETADLADYTVRPGRLTATVHGDTARRIRITFARLLLQHRPPSFAARYTSNFAVRAGYLPEFVWADAIDDPVATANTAGLPAAWARAGQAREVQMAAHAPNRGPALAS